MAANGEAQTDGDDIVAITFYGGKIVSAVPILFFILWAVLQSGLLRIGATEGLVIGALVGLIVGMLFVRGSWKIYADTIFEGMTQKVAVTAIVAWLWAGMFAQTLQAGGFVDGLVWLANTGGVGPTLFPAVTFVLAALLATGIGTGYGTTIAFVTLFYPAGLVLGTDPVLLFGAILSGAVFGDNLAPVSDTTIVSAVTQEADIGGVVSSRFKYAIVAALGAMALYILIASGRTGIAVSGDVRQIFEDEANPWGLLHLVSMGIVIATAIAGRHIIEAISWGLLVAIAFNLVTGLSSVADILVFRVPAGAPVGEFLTVLPFVERATEEAGVGGSLYTGAVGFFPMSVLVLLIVACAQIMIRGGGFEALQRWLLRTVATTVRGAELTMVLATAFVNALITINTAAEIAIAPYIANIGRRFNINGYRRANILDANTSALGYIFPWSGGVLIGVETMRTLGDDYGWWDPATMLINPADVAPYVFHGWLLVMVFVLAAVTGFGREYTTDRVAGDVKRV